MRDRGESDAAYTRGKEFGICHGLGTGHLGT
jgi:hypothetical protein